MSIQDSHISKLKDLDKLRSAPRLNKKQSEMLLNQIEHIIYKADWITIGVMSPSLNLGINAVRKIEEKYKYNEMKFITIPNSHGPVFLKANQKAGDIFVRIEHGLGEGILLSCQHNLETQDSQTFGPFPLDFFKIKD